MKRRLLSAFLAVMMVLTMAPVAFAGNEAENTVDDSASADTGYSEAAPAKTLQVQINGAENGSTVTLSENSTENITIPADKTITIDLNGNNIAPATGCAIVNKGNLTIVGDGEVKAVQSGMAAIANFPDATANVNGGTFVSAYWYVIKNLGNMTIDGPVTIKKPEGNTDTSSLVDNGWVNPSDLVAGEQVAAQADKAALTIKSGKFTGKSGSASCSVIKNDDYATLNISGGIFDSTNNKNTSISTTILNFNVATISGVTFIVQYPLSNGAYNNAADKGQFTISGGTFTGLQSVFGYGQGGNGVGLMTITGGKFTAPRMGEFAGKYELKISGGTFSTDPTAYLAENYMTEAVGNTYSVVFKSNEVAQNGQKKYVSLQNAVDDAHNGDTITLLTDVDLGDTVTVSNKTITLDMAGKTIFNTKDLWDSKPNAWSLISVRENGNLTITGNGMLKAKADDCYALDTQEETAKLTVENGTVIGNISAIYVHPGQVTIKGGNYSIQQLNNNNVQDGYGLTINCYDADYKDRTAKVTITGGYFAHFNPANNKAEGAGTNFVADGYISVTSDKSGYDYMVTKKTTVGTTDVTPDVAEPEVTASKDIPSEVTEAAKNIEAPDLATAANDIVKNIGEDTVSDLVHKSGYENPNLYVQTSLKVEAKAYDATAKTLTLDITPQYRIVASTADKADALVIGTNAKIVQEYAPATLSGDTTIMMELPADFANVNTALSIKHTKSTGVEFYTGLTSMENGKLYLTFTTNGFSPFEISAPAASIAETGMVYPTLADAVNAVEKNQSIQLRQNIAATDIATVAKTTKFTILVNGQTFDHDKNIIAGSNTTRKVAESEENYTYEFTYTKPSSGGSSGGSSSGKTTYKVTTSAVNNGGVNASPSSAEKGAAITITLSPDKGYKLDKLTVTDGSGKTVSTVKKSDTVYTFTMPASAVKVGVSYVKATETPSKTKFNDVSANDWFASAVDYVTGKGMMNGTADNTFSPKANTTRGMVVTVLYRLENQPSTSAASFTDVASGAYYANAVAWANANGIVSGYGSGKFGPNDKVTREQLAAILYRYAQYKKYDVSVGEDTNILSYDDAQSISSYAIPAIQWACGAGVVTGKSGSKLDPKGNATRAEVAAMLMRFCENVK